MSNLENFLSKKINKARAMYVRFSEEEWIILNSLVVKHQSNKNLIIKALVRKEGEAENKSC